MSALASPPTAATPPAMRACVLRAPGRLAPVPVTRPPARAAAVRVRAGELSRGGDLR